MRIQPDIIKLDRSLVQSVDSTRRAPRSSSSSSSSPAHRRQVCCEGIETGAELAALAGSASTSRRATCSGVPPDRGRRSPLPAATAIMQLQQRGLLQAPDRPVRASGPVNRRLGARAVRR
jgi:hypothetical protein